MGNSSSSSVTQNITNKIITRNDLEAINKSVSNIVTENIVKNIANNASALGQIANVNIKDIVADGSGSIISNIKISIDQNSSISQEVVDKTIQDTKLDTEIARAISQDLASKTDAKQAASLVSMASASQDLGSISLTGGNSVSSDVNTNINNYTETQNRKHLENIIENNVSQKQDMLNQKACMSSSTQEASINVGNIKATNGGTVTGLYIGISQTADIVNKCISDSMQKSEVTTKIAEALGLKVVDTVTASQEGSSTASAESTQKIRGVIEGVMEGLAGIFGAMMMPLLILGALALVAGVIIVILKMKSGKGGGSMSLPPMRIPSIPSIPSMNFSQQPAMGPPPMSYPPPPPGFTPLAAAAIAGTAGLRRNGIRMV
jgi:hypothetical protein